MIRTQPMSRLIAPLIRFCPRCRLPITNSVEPPPMSTTRNGPVAGSSSPTAPAKDSSASSSPVITSGCWPSVEVTISTKSPRFAASLVAEVATIRTRTAPDARITAA